MIETNTIETNIHPHLILLMAEIRRSPGEVGSLYILSVVGNGISEPSTVGILPSNQPKVRVHKFDAPW